LKKEREAAKKKRQEGQRAKEIALKNAKIASAQNKENLVNRTLETEVKTEDIEKAIPFDLVNIDQAQNSIKATAA